LTTLENENSDLQLKVETLTKELKLGKRQAFKRHRKAENEINALKAELERTTTKVTDLEEQNTRLIEASKMFRLRRIQLKNQLPTPSTRLDLESLPSTITAMTIDIKQGMDEMTI